MKILSKLLLSLLLSFNLSTSYLVAGPFNENHAAGLENFLENAFAEMTPEEQEAFMMEVQREQEKLMKMSPAERAQKEKEVAEQLDALMSQDSPYQEMFTKPAARPTITPPAPVERSAAKVEPAAPAKNVGSKRVTKPDIPAELKASSKELAQKIAHAIDTIVIKTNSMQAVIHAKWDEQQWQKFKNSLQVMQSQMNTIVNSDIILAEFVKDQHQDLRNDLTTFEVAISGQAKNLKTPDAMGLVMVFEGQPKIIDPARYESAILQLQKVASNLNQLLLQKDLAPRVKNLIDQHAPAKSKPVINLPNHQVAVKPVHQSTKGCPVPNDPVTQAQQAQTLVKSIQQSANQSLLDLCQAYQSTPTVNLSRKLQWRLSELETQLSKLASCKSDLKDQAGTSANYPILSQIITLLNSLELDGELDRLSKQVQAHYQAIFKA